jgi:hypothetical protein
MSDDGSRVEAAEAGVHHERAEQHAGIEPREHVTAAAAVHHHHPADPNAGLVRARPGKHALLAGALAAAVTIAGVVLLALAIGSR